MVLNDVYVPLFSDVGHFKMVLVSRPSSVYSSYKKLLPQDVTLEKYDF